MAGTVKVPPILSVNEADVATKLAPFSVGPIVSVNGVLGTGPVNVEGELETDISVPGIVVMLYRAAEKV